MTLFESKYAPLFVCASIGHIDINLISRPSEEIGYTNLNIFVGYNYQVINFFSN